MKIKRIFFAFLMLFQIASYSYSDETNTTNILKNTIANNLSEKLKEEITNLNSNGKLIDDATNTLKKEAMEQISDVTSSVMDDFLNNLSTDVFNNVTLDLIDIDNIKDAAIESLTTYVGVALGGPVGAVVGAAIGGLLGGGCGCSSTISKANNNIVEKTYGLLQPAIENINRLNSQLERNLKELKNRTDRANAEYMKKLRNILKNLDINNTENIKEDSLNHFIIKIRADKNIGDVQKINEFLFEYQKLVNILSN